MNKKILFGSIALMTGIVGFAASQKDATANNTIDSLIQQSEPKKEINLEPKPNYKINYDSLITDIHNQQTKFQQEYSIANDSLKNVLISEATDFVYDKLIKDIFPAWYETPWVFGGVASEPHPNKTNPTKKESIDCGHFVTRTLYDVGFDIQKNKLAQLASETMIKNLSQPDEIHRYRNKKIQTINTELDNIPEGLYITGLDCHTGFILNEKGNKKFIHSSYYPDQMQVVSEPIIGNNPFADSKYRVLGKILDEEMMKHWLTGEKFSMNYK